MRFLANENFPGPAVSALRNAGHDVVWIREQAPGIPDPEVLARAVADNRILITFDKDFGELAFRHGLTANSGIVLFRIVPVDAARVADPAVRILGSKADWAGHFAVVDEHRVRMTPLPIQNVNGTQ